MSSLRLGFTGTQAGMSVLQRSTVLSLVRTLRVDVVIHGDCVGADADMHSIARECCCRVEVYPSMLVKKRAYCEGDEVYPAMQPLLRNQTIVERCHILLATPREVDMQMRSGTWATVRYALRNKRRLIVVAPLGVIVQPSYAYARGVATRGLETN